MQFQYRRLPTPSLRLPLGGVGLVVLAVLALVTVANAATQIRYGTVGVVVRFGGTTGQVFHPGLSWKLPFIDSVLTYRTQKIIYEASDEPQASRADYTDLSVDTVTKDGQRITVNYTVRFSIDPAQAIWVAQNLGTEAEVVEKIVKTDSRIWARNVPKEFAASDLYTGNIQIVQDRVFEILDPIFRENGLSLDEVGLRSITFTEEYALAIEQKQIALEQVTTELYRAEQEVNRKKATITRAEAEAESIRLRGGALRENPEVIQLEFIQSLRDPNSRISWGIMPQNILPFLDILRLAEQGGLSASGGETP